MWKRTRYILAAILVAYLIGAAPSIVDFINDNFIVNTANAISLRPEVMRCITAALSKIRSYSSYFIVIYALIVAALIFLENSNPDRTLLWIAVLIFVPFLGLFIYLLIGPDFDNLRRRRNFRPREMLPVPTGERQALQLQTAQMLREISGAEVTWYNRITPLINGEETFADIFETINGAKTFIHLQSFIIKDDETGRKLRETLIAAVRRGVKVRVLYDAIGSRKITAGYVRSLNDAGVRCMSFMPVSFPMFRRKMNFRNHRKICVVDGTVAYTGGLNFSKNYIHKGRMGFWRDTHVRVEGEAVKELHKIFLADWEDRTTEKPEQIIKEDGVVYQSDFTGWKKQPVQVVPSGVSAPWHSIEMGFMSMISRAKERVWITTPYIVPGPFITSALRMAALSGVDVRIILPEKGDHFLVYWGGRAHIEELLSAGVKILLYKPGFMHAKTLLSDRDICSAGTCNLDVRSLEINFEDQLFIYDETINKTFERQFKEDFKDTFELKLEDWRKRPFCEKLLESFGRLYSAQI